MFTLDVNDVPICISFSGFQMCKLEFKAIPLMTGTSGYVGLASIDIYTGQLVATLPC